MKQSEKRGILVVSFGTSYPETRRKTIEQIEKEIISHFPNYQVRRAFTSKRIIQKLKERDGIRIDSIEEALERLEADGIKRAIVQPTHIINGYENDEMMKIVDCYKNKFECISCGEPLLSDKRDYERLITLLIKETEAYQKDGNIIIFLGHGTAHEANGAYIKLERDFIKTGYKNYLVGTVEGMPDYCEVLKKIKKLGGSSIVLLPLLIVAGEHAIHDIAGEKDSWKNYFETKGYSVTCILKGLGEYSGVRQMFIDHIKQRQERNQEIL